MRVEDGTSWEEGAKDQQAKKKAAQNGEKISTTTRAELRNREINVKKQIHFVTVRIENRREHFVEIDFFFSTLQCCFKFFFLSLWRPQAESLLFFSKKKEKKANWERTRNMFHNFQQVVSVFSRRYLQKTGIDLPDLFEYLSSFFGVCFSL